MGFLARALFGKDERRRKRALKFLRYGLICFDVFLLLALVIVVQGRNAPLFPFDAPGAWGLPAGGGNFFDCLFYSATALGEGWLILLLLAGVSVLLYFIKRKGLIFPLLFSVLGSAFFVWFFKFMIARPRPAGEFLIQETSFSFPSGHAAVSLAFYGFLVWIIILFSKTKRVKISSTALALVLVGLIGASRLYLGVHYVSDVLGGYLLGGAFLFASMALAEFFKYDRLFEHSASK